MMTVTTLLGGLLLGSADPTAVTPYAAPEFVGIAGWANGDAFKMADQKGKVMVVHFWTHGCINCIHNYPHYIAWQKAFAEKKDFRMVGVHTPEFDAEKDIDRIKAAMKKSELTFAAPVDNTGATWQAWKNRYWPCVYLVDKKGMVRHRWEGELGTDGEKQMRANIEKLLAEKD